MLVVIQSTQLPSVTISTTLIVQDKAGERILAELILDAQERLLEEGIEGEIYLFKNNTDSGGNSYGCHENFLIKRRQDYSGAD
jgi:proteasome accessory factor A